MRPDWMKPAVLITSAIASGWVGWSGHMLLLPAAAAFPVLWSHAGNRVTATGIAIAYFLAASRGFPQGVTTFYASDLWPGLLLWIGACLSFVAVHAALWTLNEKTRPLRYLIAMVLLALPPFGITGWAQINGRNAISWEDKFAYDVWYVDNRSLILDIKILLVTAMKVVLAAGISQPGRATMEPFRGMQKRAAKSPGGDP